MDRHHYERYSWNAFCQLIIVRADMRASSHRYATQIFGLAMGAVFAAMLILNVASGGGR